VSDDGEIYYTTLGKEEPVGGDILPINTLAFITPIIRLAIAVYSLAVSMKKFLYCPLFLILLKK